MPKLGKILNYLIADGFCITKCAMISLTSEQCSDFVNEVMGQKDQIDICNLLASGPVVAMELIALNAVEELKQLAGNNRLQNEH